VDKANKLSRRKVLNVLLGIGGATAVGAVLYPALSFLKPPKNPEASVRSVTLEQKFSELKPGDWFIFPIGNGPGILICTEEEGSKQVLAYSAICTHLACVVEFQPENERFFCACHNGIFDIYGNNIGGPPPRPLDKFTVHLTDDTINIVNKG